MKRTIFPLALLILVAHTPGGAESAAVAPLSTTNPQLSLLTYNVHGLPWPIVEPRGDELAQIGARLAMMRSQGTQPSVVVLQEAFTPDAMRIGSEGGYRFIVAGPAADEQDPAAFTTTERTLVEGASAFKGETEGKWEGSGLRLLSDFPILSVKRMAFPADDCAGFDCLANKGVLLVTLDVPGRGPVQIATTHLNSRAASGVPDARSILAYRRQVALLGQFLRRQVDPARPLILAGDFNVGDAPGRRPAIAAEVEGLEAALGAPVGEGLRDCVARGRIDRPDEAAYIIRRSRDFEFFYQGRTAGLTAERASIPFGREPDGSALSDHYGFMVRYRLS